MSRIARITPDHDERGGIVVPFPARTPRPPASKRPDGDRTRASRELARTRRAQRAQVSA